MDGAADALASQAKTTAVAGLARLRTRAGSSCHRGTRGAHAPAAAGAAGGHRGDEDRMGVASPLPTQTHLVDRLRPLVLHHQALGFRAGVHYLTEARP